MTSSGFERSNRAFRNQGGAVDPGENRSGPTARRFATGRTRKGRDQPHIVVYGMNYAPEMAGVGRYTGEIAEHFAATGSDVTVVTTPPHYPGWRALEGFRNRYSACEQNGVRVIRAPLWLHGEMGGIWRLIAPLTFALASAPIACWQILRRRPDIVLCVEPTLIAAPVAQWAARMVGARTVLHVQDLEVDAAFATGHLAGHGWLRRLAGRFERACLKRMDKVITISGKMAEQLVEKGVAEERLAIVRNWVDLDQIFPLSRQSAYRDELGYAADDYVILYSGNIGPKQGLHCLLDAARELRETDPKIRIVIAGEGPSKPQLERDYGDLPNVRFLPFQPYSRLNEFLALADLHALPQAPGIADLVLPSKLGGMLASGRPILALADRGSELDEFLAGSCHTLEDGADWARSIRSARAAPLATGEERQALAALLSKRSGIETWCTLATEPVAGH